LLDCLVKLLQNGKLNSDKEGLSTEKVSTWEVEKLSTALSVGEKPLPLGIALKLSN